MAATRQETYVQKLQSVYPRFFNSHMLTTYPLDYCTSNQIAQPQFQDYSDPRGKLYHSNAAFTFYRVLINVL